MLKNSSFEEEEEAGKVIDSDPSVLWEYEGIFKEAEEKNMKISLLLSPQYFVNELYDMYPGLKDNGDGIGFTLLHPAAVEAVTYHIKDCLLYTSNRTACHWRRRALMVLRPMRRQYRGICCLSRYLKSALCLLL